MPTQRLQKAELYHDRVADSFQWSVSVLVPVMAIICGLLARQGIFDPNFYESDMTFFILSAAYLLVSAVFFYFRWRKQLTTSVVFICLLALNIITLFFTLFVTGFVNVFLIGWVPLMVSTDLYFGRLGFFFSFLALVVSGVFTAVLHPNLSDPLYLIVLTQEVLGLGLLALVIAIIRRIAEKEGQQLIKVSAKEELQRQRLLSLINSMSDAVVSVNEKGDIKIYNATFLSLLDTNENILNKNIDEILQLHNRHGQPVKITKKATSAEKAKPYIRRDVYHTYPNKEHIRLYINVSPIQPSYQVEGEGGFIMVLRDITKEKTIEEEQDAFISVVSHELRTPIAIAEGNLANVDVLRKQGASQAAIDKMVHDAHTHVMSLAKIVNDLSSLSHSKQGAAATKEEIPIKPLLLELYNNYQLPMRQKGLQFKLDLPEKLPIVFTSREQVKEILDNLLSNAMKYTAEGVVTFGAHEIDRVLQIYVKDTGIGIGKSDQPHIFEKFYRSEDYRTRESSGTGLGLYLSARLAHNLGYTLTFESELNEGSVFKLIFSSQKS